MQKQQYLLGFLQTDVEEQQFLCDFLQTDVQTQQYLEGFLQTDVQKHNMYKPGLGSYVGAIVDHAISAARNHTKHARGYGSVLLNFSK